MSPVPAFRRIAPYAHAIDPRIVSLVVRLHEPKDADGVPYPQIRDVTLADGHSLDCSGAGLGQLAALAWDVVSEQIPLIKQATEYRVQLRPAVIVRPTEAVDL